MRFVTFFFMKCNMFFFYMIFYQKLLGFFLKNFIKIHIKQFLLRIVDLKPL